MRGDLKIMQIKKITEAEEVVMKAIWDCKKEPGLSEIMEIVNTVYGKDWKAQTVSTFLSNLVWKKYLKSQRIGRVFIYKICVDERTYRMTQLKQLYVFLYKSDKEALKLDMQEL